MATANGQTLLDLTITWPRRGTWVAKLELDAEEPLSGAVSIDIEGQVWNGTVYRASSDAGRGGTTVIGGAGGIHKELGAKNYAPPSGVSASTVLDDIMREAGETLSATANTTLLNTRLRTWQRREGPAAKAITRLAEKLGADWRILRDGTVWIGVDSYPNANPEHTLVDEDYATGAMVIAYEDSEIPTLEPGVTFRGKRVEQVVHTIGKNLRTKAELTSPSAELDKFNEDIYGEIDYSRLYRARVVSQNSDGTLELLPDNKIFKGQGVGRARYVLGVPGTVEVEKGQEVLLGFDGGDPSEPIAIGWFKGAMEMLNLGEAQHHVALANLVDARLTELYDWVVAHTHPTGMGPSGPPTEAGQLEAPETVKSNRTKAE